MAARARATLIFDVGFEAPLYTNGQSVVGGSEPYNPTYASGGTTAYVSESVQGFDSQAAIVSTVYGNMRFQPDAGPYDTGLHLISYDFGAPVAG
ncbi:MAG: hypothetical protein KJ626_00460, partial [Verrucomicrobia bacterium]|nr:hypothetical protein [Verrucomicrobiota bacterium]